MGCVGCIFQCSYPLSGLVIYDFQKSLRKKMVNARKKKRHVKQPNHCSASIPTQTLARQEGN